MPIRIFLAISLLASLVTGCLEAPWESEDTSDNLNRRRPAGDAASTVACFLSTCLQTEHILDAKINVRDYTYPDPANFPRQGQASQYRPPTWLVNLKDLDPKLRLSENFVLEDFMANYKGQFALFSTFAATRVQLIRNKIKKPLYVTSGYRSPGYNSSINGASRWSRHTYGDAVDLWTQGVSLKKLQKLCRKQKASFTLLYKNHVHCDWRFNKLDPAYYKPEDMAKVQAQAVLFKSRLSAQTRMDIIQTSAETIVVEISFPEHLEIENPDELVVDWRIESSTDLKEITGSTRIVLPKKQKILSITAYVGNSFVVERSF